MRAADELAKYLYMHGGRKITISLDFGDDRSYAAIAARDLALEQSHVDELTHAFSGPVQPEVASYYGSLAGRKRDEPEIELLGTMAELDELTADPAIGTRIVLSRSRSPY
jgi:hypothetical protein